MIELVALGELLIDFTPHKMDGIAHFKQNAGGAPCNMLAMAQILGTETGFIGKVGNDQFGRFLKKTLDDIGVSTRGLVLSDEEPTTLAFVHLDEGGDRSFSFYRRGCADVMLRPADVDGTLLADAKAVHFGSLSFTDEPSRSTVLEVIRTAKDAGKLISYDPNYRPALWPDEDSAIAGMDLGLQFADMLKVSDEEALLITGEKELESAAVALYKKGIKFVCITLGANGVYYYHQNGHGRVEGFPSTVVDTTGAGDSFFGAVVHQVLAYGQPVESLRKEVIESILTYGNAVASLCIEGNGGIPSLPSKDRIEARLEGVF